MGNAFQRAFNPTDIERRAIRARVNGIIEKKYKAWGECCVTCKHEKYVQVSPYYDYTTCEFDKTVEFGFGEGAEYHRCDKWEFCGYLSEEDFARGREK